MRDSSPFSLSTIFTNAQLVYRLYRDERVPALLKAAVPLGVALYFIMPLDLIPDFIPVLGQLDDLAVAVLAMSLFINLAPQPVVDEHRRALGLIPPLPGEPAPPKQPPATGA